MNVFHFDWDNIAQQSWLIKASVILFVCTFMVLLGYALDLKKQNERLTLAEKEYLFLQETQTKKQNIVAALSTIQQQKDELTTQQNALLQYLTTEDDIPALVNTLNDVSIQNNVRLTLIELQVKKQKSFYQELPIHMEVTGDYSHLVALIKRMIEWPQMMTVHDVAIKKQGSVQANQPLVMTLTAKAYLLKRI